MLKKWEELPSDLQVPEVRPYWEALDRKRVQLAVKRAGDLVLAVLLLVLLAIPMVVIAVMIRLDSEGPVFYRQERVTRYGRHFRIHKFRTMVVNAEQLGSAVTTGHDKRITKIGSRLRGHRLDELPQVLDVLSGNMSFVGTRPEAVRYVGQYRPEWRATLLMPAGITSEASIRYKDEERLLEGAANPDRIYMEEIVPEKMKWNLESLRNFGVLADVRTMLRTVAAVFGM